MIHDTHDTLKIGWRNAAQVALFDGELKGQISDGKWENSLPKHHYKAMIWAKSFVASETSELGPNFNPMRRYRFNDSKLYDCVGDRMLALVKAVPGYGNATDADVRRELRDMGRIMRFVDSDGRCLPLDCR